MNKKEILNNGNSSVNQEVKGKLISREIYTCFTHEMNSILAVNLGYEFDDLPNYDNIENYWIYPGYSEKEFYFEGGSEEDKEKAIEELEEMIENEKFPLDRLEEIKADIENLETEPHEIFEWWIISENFYNFLNDNGYPTIAWRNNYYWGRCTTGQAILSDYVITQFAYNMGILEGQEKHKYWIK